LALSPDERVEFDGIMDRLIGMVAEVAAPESHVMLRRSGEFGELSAELATPLVMVLNELMQNAVEHAFTGSTAGTVLIIAERSSRTLKVSVRDDGTGLPAGFDLETSDRLGLQIVRTLVGSELRGTIDIASRPSGGTDAVVEVPLIHRA
jgi:two-component sensor histidine kinase